MHQEAGGVASLLAHCA